MKATGKTGQLRVGGRVAASLTAWSYDGTPDKWAVEADVAAFDDFLFESGGPFELRLDVGENVWKWRGVTVTGRSRVTIHGSGRHE